MPTDLLSSAPAAGAFDDGEESIYKLIPHIEIPKPKAPMYRSKYPHDVPPSGSTFGRYRQHIYLLISFVSSISCCVTAS